MNYITYLQEEESEKMITLQQIDKLLETKFAKFENRIVSSLTNSIDDNSGIIKEVKLNVTEKHDAVLPSSVIPSSPAVIKPSMLASMVSSPSPVSSLPAIPAQSVYDELADLQIKQVRDLHHNIYITIILFTIFCLKTKNVEFRIYYLNCILT